MKINWNLINFIKVIDFICKYVCSWYIELEIYVYCMLVIDKCYLKWNINLKVICMFKFI